MDELQLFSLHALNHLLMLNSLVLFSEHLVFDLLFGAHLPLKQVSLPLVLRLLLLAADHLLQRIVLDLLLMLLHLHKVFLFALLHFEVIDVSSDLVLHVPLLRINVILDLLLHILALCPSKHLLFLLLSHTLHPFSGYLHVALAGAKNVVSALLSLIEFFPSLI